MASSHSGGFDDEVTVVVDSYCPAALAQAVDATAISLGVAVACWTGSSLGPVTSGRP